MKTLSTMTTMIFTLALLAVFLPLSAKAIAPDSSVSVKATAGINVDVGEGNGVSSRAYGDDGIEIKMTAKGNATSTEARGDEDESANDASDDIFVGSVVSVAAKEMRGWDSDAKAKFLLTVKSQAELRSEADLDNFAKGVLLKDENIKEVEAKDNHVSVTYKMPAKFLGIFATELGATANVTATTTSQSGTPKKEVTVKFPWYRIFYSLNAEARADVIETAIENSLSVESGVSLDTAAEEGRTIQILSNILKSIRAKVAASGEAEVD